MFATFVKKLIAWLWSDPTVKRVVIGVVVTYLTTAGGCTFGLTWFGRMARDWQVNRAYKRGFAAGEETCGNQGGDGGRDRRRFWLFTGSEQEPTPPWYLRPFGAGDPIAVEVDDVGPVIEQYEPTNAAPTVIDAPRE